MGWERIGHGVREVSTNGLSTRMLLRIKSLSVDVPDLLFQY
jgi:hypothetical protein